MSVANSRAPRQGEAIAAFPKRAGHEIVAEYADEGVKGADMISDRPGFTAALAKIAGNGVRTIIVETTSRFARDLVTQEVGFRQLRDAGTALIAADSPDSFLDDTPTAVLIRLVLGAVKQFENAALVANCAPRLIGSGERLANAVAARATPSATPTWWPSPRSWRAIPSMAASARCERLPPCVRSPATSRRQARGTAQRPLRGVAHVSVEQISHAHAGRAPFRRKASECRVSY